MYFVWSCAKLGDKKFPMAWSCSQGIWPRWRGKPGVKGRMGSLGVCGVGVAALLWRPPPSQSALTLVVAPS
jgi:hypothetical protein